MLDFVPGHPKTQETCAEVIEEDPDWFVTQEQTKEWHEDFDSDDDDELITWRNGACAQKPK